MLPSICGYGEKHADNGQGNGNIIAAVEGIHRVLVTPNTHAEDTYHAGNNAEGTHHQREENPGNIAGNGIDSNTQYHSPDILSGSRFKEVGTTPGTVANIVAHQISDNGSIAGVILGYTGFNLAHQVSPHISGFGIDTTAELGKEGDKAGTKAKTDNKVRGDIRGIGPTIGKIDSGYPQQAIEPQQENRERHRHAGQRLPPLSDYAERHWHSGH